MISVSINRIAITICDRRIFSILLLLLASIVMAETRLKLNFPDEFYNKQLPDSKFNRSNQSQNNKSETKARQWHKDSDKSSNRYRWKGIEFHYVDRNEQYPHTIPDSYDKLSAPQTELKPQLELRF